MGLDEEEMMKELPKFVKDPDNRAVVESIMQDTFAGFQETTEKVGPSI